MKRWLRRVTPDLFLAAVIALLLTLAVNALNTVETRRILSDERGMAHDGLTLDERIAALERSIGRSVFLHLPLLVIAASIAIGLVCRQRRWAWLLAILAVTPTLLMAVSFFIDLPLASSSLVLSYVVISVVVASSTVSLRRRLLAAQQRSGG